MSGFGDFPPSGLTPSMSHFATTVATVVAVDDPLNLGRIKLKFPWMEGSPESDWVRVAVLTAGKDRGTYFLPLIDDEVLVTFVNGDINFPVVLGSLWTDKNPPPANATGKANKVQTMVSATGMSITLDDSTDKGRIQISDQSQENFIELDLDNRTIAIISAGKLVLEAAKGISLNSDGPVEVKGSEIKLTATASMALKADGKPVKIDGMPVNINGEALKVM